MTRSKFSDEELQWIRSNAVIRLRDYINRFRATFDRLDISDQCLKDKRRGWTQSTKRPTHPDPHMRSPRPTQEGYVPLEIAGRRVFKHRWMWEQVHGPIPAGMVLMCRSDERANCDPGNWEMVERGVHGTVNNIMRRNGLAPEMRPIVLTLAKLKHRLRGIAKEKCDVE